MTQVAGLTAVAGVAMVHDADTGWAAATSVGPGRPYSLNAVTAYSPTDAWAVGQTQRAPLIGHWDGAAWRLVPCDWPASLVGAGLLGVDAASASAAIAVGGAYDRMAGTEVALVRHWDGSTWQPCDAGTGLVLTDVTMPSVREAWAVGHGSGGPVALHWDGTAWTPADLPKTPRGRFLAVAASGTRSASGHASAPSAGDVWAVGADDRTALIMRFDGQAWHRVRPPAGTPKLTSVVALPDGEVWAAGGSGLLHWNGRRWRQADPGIPSVNTLTALSPADVWAGGASGLAHFDGRRWQPVTSVPELDGSATWLGSAAVAPATVWMVGSRTTSVGSDPLTGRELGNQESRAS
ncbi:MAG TPA: hypothetical protein VNW94_22785 [Streptosporangiaceae bacterium]|nr:hypothetical protein [Streptosporangiaceae bacterium]